MILGINIRKLLTAFISLLFLMAFKNDVSIILVNERLPYNPHMYYFAGVVDERLDKGSLAQVIIKSHPDKLQT